MIPTLACMGGIDIFLILGIMFLAGVGLFAVSFIPYRFAIRKLAQSETKRGPAALFGATLCITLAWAGILYLLNVSFVAHDNKQQIAIGFCATLGSLMMLLLLLLKSNPAESGTTSTVTQHGRFQIWAQDLFIALVCYGAGLAILSAVFGYDRSRTDEFLPWAGYILLAGTTGLLFAIDLCRRESWAPLKRAIVFVVVFTFFPLILPLALLAWWRWRRALTLQAKLAQPT